MISQCPQCRKRLGEFAVKCRCGWSFVEVNSGEPIVALAGVDQSNAAYTTVQVESDRSADRNSASRVIDADDSSIHSIGDDIPNGSLPTSDSQTSLVISDSATRASQASADSDVALLPTQVDLQIQKAKELISEEEFSKALGYLGRAINDAPRERVAECYSLRGYIHYRLGDVVKAEEECTKAIDQNWEDANTYAWRAAARGEQNRWRLAFDDLQAACDIAGGNRDEYFRLMDSYAQVAKSYFQAQIKSGVDSAELFNERGWVYYRRSQASKAERDFKQALNRDKTHAWASLGLARVHREAGVAQHLSRLLESALQGELACQRLALRECAELHFAQGDVNAANKDLARLALLAGDDSRAIVEVCRLRSQLDGNIQAISDLTKLLETKPEEHFAWLVRGQCYAAIKNYPLAIKDVSRFLRFFPEHVEALTDRAQSYLGTRKFAKAHQDLDDAEEVDPNHYRSRLLRAKLLLAEDRLDSALTECAEAIRIENHAEAFATKAKIYHKLCDFSAAIEEYGRAIDVTHGDVASRAEYLYLRGTMLYELEDFSSAMSDFEAACSLRPNHSGSWVWKAATASRLENWTESIASLQRAIESRPANAAAYQKLGKPVAKKAIEFFDRQQQRGQASIETFLSRAMAYQFLGEHEAAVKDFTIAIEKTPGDDSALIRRGQSFFVLGKHKLANKDFTQVIGENPENHEARYFRACARKEAGNLTAATSDIRKAIKLNPEPPKYHVLLSEIYLVEGNTSKAIRALDKAILRDPTDPLVYRRRANVHGNNGDTLRAIRDFTHAIELDPSQFETLVARGHAYLKSNQMLLAREDFELALTHNPRLAKAYSGRATVLMAEEKYEYTLIWLTKALHRFESPRDLAEILFARGKVFAQMGRLTPAAADFSYVIDLVRNDPRTLIAARHARALTNIQNENYDKALKDYRRILKLVPDDRSVNRVLQWLEDPTAEQPGFLPAKPESKSPTRPTACRTGILVETATIERCQVEPPYDSWIVRSDEKEYGPVPFNILQNWIESGRIDLGMRVLRSDWSKWKRVEKIFPEMLPFHGDTNFVDEFPELNL